MKKTSRRKFLASVASTAAAACVPQAGIASDRAGAAVEHEAPIPASENSGASMTISHSGYRLEIDLKKGGISALRSTYGIERDLLIPRHIELPLFKIELMDERSAFRAVTSAQAEKVAVRRSRSGSEDLVMMDFRSIGGLPLHARASVRCPDGGALTYWGIEVTNGTDMWIGHIQFPVIQIPFDDLAKGEFSHILCSPSDGLLVSPVSRGMKAGAWNSNPRNSAEVWRSNNYPGEWTSTQLMAYYNDAGGLYLACDDATGLPKYLGPLLDENGVTMALGHYPGTCGPGHSALPYSVVVGTFAGDWYSAAEIYRSWAERQAFCPARLAERTDMPKWVAESPIAIAFPMRGECDWDSPATINPEYTPATNALPYLDKLAAELGCALMPIVFNWERPGPWVQPDAFPPLDGAAEMRDFMARAKQKGWHPVLYGDGLCWVIWQKNTGYDGMPYFRSHGGEAALARKWDGTLLEDIWAWRKNYVVCAGTQAGREMVLNMTRRIAELGPDVVQQFDQTPGPRACYARDHGHPPVPGPWMRDSFAELLKQDARVARDVNPAMMMACEGAPAEVYMRDFETWDARVRTCPLYSFLFHEYGVGHQGFYTNRISDEALRLSVARAIVTGYSVDFTLRDNGQIEYDWDQKWLRAVPDQAAILDWAKRLNAFRAGRAKEYLIYGRMLRPWKISGITERDLGWGLEPLVPAATWQAQDGNTAMVLVNASDLPERPVIELPGAGRKQFRLVIDEAISRRIVELPHTFNIDLPPRSICLIEFQQRL